MKRIKIIKGYGFSVNFKDNKIVLKKTHDTFKKSESEEWFMKKTLKLVIL